MLLALGHYFFIPCFGQFRLLFWFTTGIMESFYLRFAVKTPQPPTNTDKSKPCRLVHHPARRQTHDVRTNQRRRKGMFLQNIMLFIYNGAERLL